MHCFVKKNDETVEHLLWDCECVQKIVTELIHWLSQHGIHITIDEKSFLFGLVPNLELVNKLVLMELKYYIYILHDVAKAN